MNKDSQQFIANNNQQPQQKLATNYSAPNQAPNSSILYVDVRNREEEEATKRLFKQTIPMRFDLEQKWLKGDQYAHILQNRNQYAKVFGYQHFEKKTHPENIYLNPQNGQVYFVKGNTIGSDFGFPRLGIKKHYKWKKMNFTTDLPKRNPLVSYIVASAVQAEKFFEGGTSKVGPVFRMHAVILKPDAKVDQGPNYILCHIRQVQDTRFFLQPLNDAARNPVITHPVINPEIEERTVSEDVAGVLQQEGIDQQTRLETTQAAARRSTRRQQAMQKDKKRNQSNEEIKDQNTPSQIKKNLYDDSINPLDNRDDLRKRSKKHITTDDMLQQKLQKDSTKIIKPKDDLVLQKRRRRAYTEIGDLLFKGHQGETDPESDQDLFSLQDLPAVRRTLRNKREEKLAKKQEQRQTKNQKLNSSQMKSLSDALASGLGEEGSKFLTGISPVTRRLSMEEINISKEKKALIQDKIKEWLKNFSKEDLIEQTKEYFQKNNSLKSCVQELLPQQQSSGSRGSPDQKSPPNVLNALDSQVKSSSESLSKRSKNRQTNSTIDHHQEFLEKVFMQHPQAQNTINQFLPMPGRDRNDSFSAFKRYDKTTEKPFISPRISFTNNPMRQDLLQNTIQSSLQNNMSATNQLSQIPVQQGYNALGDVFTNFLAQQLAPQAPQQQIQQQIIQQQPPPMQQAIQQSLQQPLQQPMQQIPMQIQAPPQPQQQQVQQQQQQPQNLQPRNQVNNGKFGDIQALPRLPQTPNLNLEQPNGPQMKAQQFQDQFTSYNINSVNMLEQILGGTNRSKLSFDFTGKNAF